MDHDRIEREHIPARYVMNQLTDADAASFEAHYLDCPTCLERLEIERAIHRGVLGLDDTERARATASKPGFLTWLAMAPRAPALTALAALLILALLPTFLTHRADSAQIPAPRANTPIFELEPVRDAGTDTIAPNRVRAATEPEWWVFSLRLSAPEEIAYHTTLTSAEGDTIWQSDALTPNQLGALVILFPSDTLPAGDYRFEVTSPEKRPVHTFRFQVTRD